MKQKVFFIILEGQSLKQINFFCEGESPTLTVLDYYDSGIGMVKDYHSVLKSPSELRASADFKKIRPSPEMALNNHNIVNVKKKLLDVRQLR